MPRLTRAVPSRPVGGVGLAISDTVKSLLIAPGLHMPDTFRSVLREDWKFLTGVGACSVGLAGLMFAATAALAGLSGDPAMAQMLVSYSAY